MLRTFPRISLSLAFLFCLFLAVAARAQTYDAAADFSPTTNPNGAWSYGYSNSSYGYDFGPFTLYTGKYVFGPGTVLQGWYNPGFNGPPNVTYNPTSNPVSWDTVRYEPHQLALHPGPNWLPNYSQVAWTAPKAGFISVHAAFKGIDVGGYVRPNGTDTAVHVRKNGVSIFVSLVDRYLATASFDTLLQVAAGDRIDFAVGRVYDDYNSSTALSATVTYVGKGPYAKAGPDQTVTVPPDANPNTNTATFKLDGSHSVGNALTYEWSEGGSVLGTSPTLSLTRTAGVYTFTLKVTDSASDTATDDVQVTVLPEPQFFDAAADFSSTKNPNGVWSYGYSWDLTSQFTLYPTRFADTINPRPTAIDGWFDAGINGPPDVTYNSSSDPLSWETVRYEPHQLALHPGDQWEPHPDHSHVRWTAPKSGPVSVQAVFTGIDVGGAYSTIGTNTDVHVLRNGASLFDSLVQGYLATASYSGTVQVAAGDRVDFAVGRNGDYHDDSTALSAILAYVSTAIPLDMLSINYAFAGGTPPTVTATGSGYKPGAVITWDGTPLPTTYISSTQVRTALTADKIAAAGVFQVRVQNPDGGLSNACPFTVLNRLPNITSITPAVVTHGGAGFTLEVIGTQFLSGSIVYFRGYARTTTCVSATKLTIQVTADDIAAIGKAEIRVTNPTPGGGMSNGKTLVIQ